MITITTAIAIIFVIRSSKVDCVEESACNKAEINDACSQVVMMVMKIMVVMVVLMVLVDIAVMATMVIARAMAMAIKRFLSMRKMRSFSQVSECPTKDCYNDMEIPQSESSSQGEADQSN